MLYSHIITRRPEIWWWRWWSRVIFNAEVDAFDDDLTLLKQRWYFLSPHPHMLTIVMTTRPPAECLIAILPFMALFSTNYNSMMWQETNMFVIIGSEISYITSFQHLLTMYYRLYEWGLHNYSVGTIKKFISSGDASIFDFHLIERFWPNSVFHGSKYPVALSFRTEGAP